MKVEPGKYYRLRVPSWVSTLGQGTPPAGWGSTLDGRTVRVPWGGVIRASETVQTPGDDNASPTVVHTTALRTLAGKGQLEEIDD